MKDSAYIKQMLLRGPDSKSVEAMEHNKRLKKIIAKLKNLEKLDANRS